MKSWELIPKTDRPDAQVLLTLPNSEMEYVEGFLYQEYRFVPSRGGPAALTPVGSPHTRYRYRPRQVGTYRWLHRTPPGGTLEQGAFVVETIPASIILSSLENSRTLVRNLDLPVFTGSALLLGPGELAGLQAIERAMVNLPAESRCVRVRCDTATGPSANTGDHPDLAREWLLDAVMRAAEEHGVAVVLHLPAPTGPETLSLHTALHRFLCRYAALPALAAWELTARDSIFAAAQRFLQAYDPYHPIIGGELIHV
jgi:hypothetical protein